MRIEGLWRSRGAGWAWWSPDGGWPGRAGIRGGPQAVTEIPALRFRFRSRYCPGKYQFLPGGLQVCSKRSALAWPSTKR